jgi:hypothetical protein
VIERSVIPLSFPMLMDTGSLIHSTGQEFWLESGDIANNAKRLTGPTRRDLGLYKIAFCRESI